MRGSAEGTCVVVPEPRGGVSEGKIRLRQPLTGQGAGAHDAGLQGLLLAAVALTRGAEKSTGSHREHRTDGLRSTACLSGP